MNLSQAVQTLEERLAIPAFFNRLAQYGIVPRTEQEAMELLNLSSEMQKVASQIVPIGAPEPGSSLESFVMENVPAELLKDSQLLEACRIVIEAMK